MNLTMLCKSTFLHDKNAERALKERGTERRERERSSGFSSGQKRLKHAVAQF